MQGVAQVKCHGLGKDLVRVEGLIYLVSERSRDSLVLLKAEALSLDETASRHPAAVLLWAVYLLALMRRSR